MEDRTINAEKYIKEVFPIALKSGNRILEDSWTYQQNGAKLYIHELVEKWPADNFSSFIPKDCCQPNSPDLCQLDYSLWNELAESMD